MIGAILGGFTILGAFLTFAAWVNRRSTISEQIEGIPEKTAYLLK